MTRCLGDVHCNYSDLLNSLYPIRLRLIMYVFFFFFFLNCIKEALKATQFKIKFHNEIKPYKSLRIISLIITKLRVMIVTENNFVTKGLNSLELDSV